MERELKKEGYNIIAGADEAGRGCWAGPLVAAAVIMPDRSIEGINDSKKLSHKRRVELFPKIIESASAWAVVSVTPEEVDAMGVHQANLFALSHAITHLDIEPDIVLIDGFAIDHYYNTLRVVSGDQLSYNIGAASILAKVVRDYLMMLVDRVDGRYHFGQHKGYGTALHRQQLAVHGPSQWHRKSFAPIKKLLYT